MEKQCKKCSHFEACKHLIDTNNEIFVVCEHFTPNKTINSTNCRRCGKPVKYPITFHTAYFETKVGKVAEQICDKYCKFPGECNDQDELDKHCDNCVLIKLMNIGKTEEGGK